MFVVSTLTLDLSVLSLIGAVVISFYFLKFLSFILTWCFEIILVTFRLNTSWKGLGKWALVTGGSDGIGKAYAEELAAKGFKIILVSRTLEKLRLVADEITSKYNVETKVLVADFADGPSMYEKIRPILDDLEIGVLVNNVGMSYEYAELLHALPNGIDTIEKLIHLNIVSCTMMTKIVLSQMEKRRKGLIINISSIVAVYPMPLLNVYSASKAYVDYFSRALCVEYKSKGILVQSVLPGYVATKMSRRRVSLEIPSSETFVKSAIKTVGIKDFTFGYFAHEVRGALHQWLKYNMPTWINMKIALHFMKISREKYFRKIVKVK